MGRLKGFTLVELMMVMAIFGIISSVAITIYFQLVQATNRATIVAQVEQNASYVMEIMVREIRKAGCAEVDAGALNLEGPECSGVEVIFSTADGNLVKTEDLTETVINNPSQVLVQSLSFSVDPTGQSVTIDLVMESARPAAHSEFTGELSLHETVTLRNY